MKGAVVPELKAGDTVILDNPGSHKAQEAVPPHERSACFREAGYERA